MQPNEFNAQNNVKYFFLRSKDVHAENGLIFITLFARLTREFTQDIGGKKIRKLDPVWVEIEEVKMEHSTEKIRALPKSTFSFNVSEKIFHELLRTALISPRELHYLTPFYDVNENKEIS